ncbi:Fic family protein [Niveibacterium terrae]|uniref:Fic family protein n=1 Tax=Niveibacterium terrae TaxID=3373598 RepID=UPI003A91066F
MRKTDLSAVRQQRLVPVGAHSGAFAYVPEPTPVWLPLDHVAAAGVLAAGEALARLRGIAESVPNADLFARTLDRREAVRSSQIEGTQSDLHDLLEYEITGDAEGLSHDTGVTYGYVKALHAGLIDVRQQGASAFSVELIHRLHSILMEQDERYASTNKPGAFKTRQNWIGSGRTIYDARFVPAPPEAVSAAIDDLVRYLQGEAYQESPYLPAITLRMAIAHAQFETIHPYPDGNGRVGRLLLPLMLAADAAPPVYLSGYLKSRQREYYDALAGVQLRGEWDAWVTFFSATVASCADETSALILAARALRDDWRARLKAYRADAAVHRVVDLLLARPVVTVSSLVEELRVSFPTANTAVAQMIAAGILSAAHSSRRNRVFHATELLSLIERGDGA